MSIFQEGLIVNVEGGYCKNATANVHLLNTFGGNGEYYPRCWQSSIDQMKGGPSLALANQIRSRFGADEFWPPYYAGK
jgi:hypothetical protein